MTTNDVLKNAADSPIAGKRVLIAEDDFYIAADLAYAFEREGAVVVGPLSTLAEGVAAASSGNPLDGAVLDINLFGERTYPLVDMLRERGVPCVLATGYGRSAIPILYQHIPHHQKPFDSQAVIASLFG
ncbi:response regulator [Aureimonas sp. AU4]|uniref:response regulator n=1 Tax=Aureimonas sp. AU4 TaxID=1638163 RepID=UPI000705C6D3|nr:response regulator [Aureimonas sp. AU4]BAT30586.1 response regulator receiver protein [Aureimonas sp. AU4]